MEDGNSYTGLRRRMVETQIAARGISDLRVLHAMEQIPRHLFVPPRYREAAYDDCPLPIGEGQTISQPYIVAFMTDLLEPGPNDRVLEIGGGSGYQAAILAQLVRSVITIERIPAVAEMARQNLAQLSVANVKVMVGDGTLGWSADAPYDGIIVTAAAPFVPPAIAVQLTERGRLVIPVGDRDIQQLVKLTRRSGQLVEERYGGVRFVPLIGEQGWKE